MGVFRELELQLTGDNNETFTGKLTIETVPVYRGNGSLGQETPEGVEPDPVGASSYVIAVVLIYGLSIVFLIGSHVIIKKRELHRDNEKQINKFLEQAPVLREKSAKDSYKSLKHSIIPVVALSPARDLVARRKSFAQFIQGLAPPSRRGSQERRDSGHHLTLPEDHHDQGHDQGQSSELKVHRSPRHSPRLGEEEARRMSVIEEESESDLDRSQAGSFKDKLRGARIKSVASVPKVPEEQEPHETQGGSSMTSSFGSDSPRATFYMGDTSSGSSIHGDSISSGLRRHSLPEHRPPQHQRSDSFPKFHSPARIWSTPRPYSSGRPPGVHVHSLPLIHGTQAGYEKEDSPDTQTSTESHSSSDTEHLLQVTCV